MTKGRRIHPTPSQPSAGSAAWEQLAALPAALLALAAALTPQEQEVLAYLLSGGGGAPAAAGRKRREQRQRRPHPPELGCGCFGCYKSFWERWDASPNRHVIHTVIDAVEERLELGERGPGGGSRRRRRGGRKGGILATPEEEAAAEQGSFAAEKKRFPELDAGQMVHDDGSDEVDGREDDGEVNSNSNSNAKSSVRRFVSFIGERVWGAWN